MTTWNALDLHPSTDGVQTSYNGGWWGGCYLRRSTRHTSPRAVLRVGTEPGLPPLRHGALETTRSDCLGTESTRICFLKRLFFFFCEYFAVFGNLKYSIKVLLSLQNRLAQRSHTATALTRILYVWNSTVSVRRLGSAGVSSMHPVSSPDTNFTSLFWTSSLKKEKKQPQTTKTKRELRKFHPRDISIA